MCPFLCIRALSIVVETRIVFHYLGLEDCQRHGHPLQPGGRVDRRYLEIEEDKNT